jgi:hypothetical protein
MKKILSFLGGLLSHAGDFVRDHVQPSVDLVERLKAAVDSPVADILTALIPGTLDDTIKAQLSKGLDIALKGLQLPLAITRKKSLAAKLQALVELLKNCQPEARKALYARIASLIAQQGAPVGIDGHVVDFVTQATYTRMKSDVAQEPLQEAAAAIIPHRFN